jgi:predicted nicotinamide N-methyase
MRPHADPVLAPVPLVPEIVLHTARELLPVWRTLGGDVPFWCVPWAGGQALARWVLDHAEAVRGRRILDVGTGSGLVAIAAVRAGAAAVRAIDLDPLACEACARNAAANGVAVTVEQGDGATVTLDADVVLAGDVWYDRTLATRLAPHLRACHARVLTGDPHRAYAPTDLVTLATYDVPTQLELESSPSRLTRVAEIPTRRSAVRGSSRRCT